MEKELTDAITNHRLWVESIGEKGERINLEDKIIEEINDINLELSQSSFIGCTFRKIEMHGWDFYAAHLCSSIFEESSILSGGFVKANLAYVEFRNTKMKHINMSKTDLTKAIFTDTEIIDGKFMNALLDCVEFRHTHLTGIDFTGAYIENVLFDNSSVLKNIKGLEDAHIKTIYVETKEKPAYLKDEAALCWLKREVCP